MGAPPTPLTPGQPAPLAPGEFTGASQPQVVDFLFKKVTPPSLLYVQRDDFLAATVLSSIAGEVVTITARLLLATEGRITTVQFTVAAPTAYTLANGQSPLAEGYLLSVVAVAASAVQPGRTYVTVFINRGVGISLATAPGAVLGAGYTTNVTPVAWPGGGIMRSTDGAGASLVFTVANPAAGADWSTSPNANAQWQLIAVSAALVTSAAAANRNITLRLRSLLATVYNGDASASVLANTTAQITGAPGQNSSTLIGTNVFIPLPPNTLLTVSNSIISVTTNIQGADQWSAIRVWVREWLAL